MEKDTLIRKRILETYILEWEDGADVAELVDATLDTVAHVKMKNGRPDQIIYCFISCPIMFVKRELNRRLFDDWDEK